MNSLLVAILAATASATCPLIVGYCTAMYDYKFSRFVIAGIYVLMAMPIVGSLPSEIKMMQNIGLYNKLPGVFFLKFTFCGMYCLIYNSSFKSVPKDFVEAAKIDGASDFMIFRKVMFPLVSNTFTIAFILSFVSYWADYSTVLYFMPSHPTLSLALLNFNSLSGTTETMQLAAALLLCIPSMLVFSIFSKNLTKNLQMGGIKG
jgi:ABC-type glycerol-3-phosphate transport system permease component